MNLRSRQDTRKTRGAQPARALTAYLVILLFALLYSLAELRWQLSRRVGAAYLLLSLFCLVLFAWDKAAARGGRRRIAENQLLFWSMLGGWPGALIAQAVFHHKINKTSFRLRFCLVTTFNVMCFIAFATPAIVRSKALFF